MYNDLNSDLVNFFRVLRNKEKAAELIRRLKLTPYAREEYYSFYPMPEEGDDIERAGGLSPAPPAGCLALRVLMVMIQKPSAAGRRCAGRCAVTATFIFFLLYGRKDCSYGNIQEHIYA